MRSRFSTHVLVILSVSVAVNAQMLREFKGKLETELRPDMIHVYQRVFQETRSNAVRFVPTIKKGVRVTSGAFTDQTLPSGNRTAYLVEESDAVVFLGIDLNNDGTIGPKERFPFTPIDSRTFESVINIPITHPLFKSFPIFVRYYVGFRHPQLPRTSRLLEQSVWASAFGRVEIEGKHVLFQYPFDPLLPEMSTTRGLFGIDSDGNGVIHNEQFSAETSYANDDELVFRYGDMYLSTSSIDLKRNEVTVRERRKDEYFKIELELGKVMPDFKFIDFDGNERSLSEFRGKYLLVDFWGLWCFDCLQETPFHVAAYKRFKSRGFDILSINTDENIDPVKEYMKKNGMEWTQAKNESVRQLIERDYRIQEYPTSLLLDPDGKVLVLDQKQLRGNQLILTLERTLPK